MADSNAATADQTEVEEVPGRIVAAWHAKDADAFAATFTEDGSMILPGDVYLTGRQRIRDFMAEAFSGPYRGTQVTGTPLAVKPLADDVVLVLTQGGVLADGESEVPAANAIRASWLLRRVDGRWLITAYQNTPIAA
ncbi:MAG: SgcJ/EcaC family oxidoreductase [Jatrophihabitantaceae bacterium]